MKTNLFSRLLLVVIFLGLHQEAFANFVGNDTSNFNPVPSGLDFVTVHSSRTLSSGYLNMGLYFNQATNSLPDTRTNNGQIIGADDRMIFADLGIALGITDRLEAALGLSYLVDQQVDRNEPGAQFAGTGLNEIKFLAKYAFFRGESWGSAVLISVNVNETRNNPFVGDDGGPSTNFEAVVDYRRGGFVTALNAGYRVRNEGPALTSSVYDPMGDQIIASLAASYYFTSLDTKIIAEIWANKLIDSTKYFSRDNVSSEALLGAKYDYNTYTALHAGGGTRISEGFFTPDWRMYVGLSLSWDAITPPAATVPTEETLIPVAQEKPKESVEIVRIENLDFDFGSSKIQARHHSMLNHLIDFLASKPNVKKITVEGHTDSIGSAERNRLRSQERADNVKKYFVASGKLKHLEIDAIGYGAERPIADNGNFQGRTLNRRVEVRIVRDLD
ncbi:hypothetical protein AZI86_00180 [Bdellovibrio bacteriovorus]|uniref:OmpA-like domain-containing protein n=1 Tax=Bdellovibrio bacteriovorus TaxID=959 RepID=A0A150WM50_BDEBC|nr:OmpA family protein [Bdellovibrio bacteriovorus]KYG65532.1 hypothetical protein AZI86_00180 [Bdellovibrio bacteriovorus]